MNKKGIQLNQAFGAVLTLVLVAVLVIIAVVLFVNLATSFAGTTAVTITDESLTPAASVAASATDCSFGDFVLGTVANSSGDTMAAGNYTSTSAGLITNTTELTGAAASPWLVDYTYTWGSEACESSESMVKEFANYTSLIGLVGTLIFLGLVIGVLVASFAFGGDKRV